MRITLSFLFPLFLILLTPSFSFAQRGSYDSYTLSASDVYPSPGEEVSFIIEPGSSQTEHIRSVRWYVNGEEQQDHTDSLRMTEISGNGPKQVVATIVFFDIIGQRRYTQVSRWMRPVIFDILWEGDSAAIPLYRGHHLAGPGVPVRISANIQYIDRNGNLYTEKDFSFRWEVESLFHEDEGPGVSAIVYEDGADYLNRFISVKSYARLINEPSIAFEEFISIPVSEPRVLPYSHTLLHGLSHLTVPENTLLNRQPFTISVYPFYFSRSDFEKNAIQYSWFVNNSPAPVKKGRKIDFSVDGGRVSIPILLIAENDNTGLQKAEHRFSFTL